MDPISAISFVGAVAGLVDLIAKGVLTLSDLQSRYRIADIKVSLLIGQLSTIKAALIQVGLLLEDVSHAPRNTQLVSALSMSLSSLGTIISALDNQLSQLQRNAEDGLSNWGKVNFVWDEQTMRDYLSLLDHQVNALGLLLSALQCRTILEQSDILSTRESRHILQIARDETSSMRWLTDSNSIAGTLQSVGTQDLGTLHARFDFDSEVLTSRAYMVASRANMIDALTGYRHNGVSHSMKITGGPPRHASSLDESNQMTPTGIALTTIVDVDSVHDSASESLSLLSQDTITEPQTSPTAVVRASDSDAELPDFTIHTPETLGLLALELGSSPSPQINALPTTTRRVRDGLSKSSTRLPLRLRLRKQVLVPVEIGRVQACEPPKILILGISESGKTTLAKTMRAAHGDMNESWLEEYRFTVLNNTILSLKWLLLMADQTPHWTDLLGRGALWDAKAFSTSVQLIGELGDNTFPPTSYLAPLGSAAQYLWNHPYIREVFKVSGTAKLPIDPGSHWDLPLYLPDCAKHFLNSIERIFKTDYLPSLEDVLWAQTRTTGTWESKFVINGSIYQLFDVGGARSERKKWIYAFENVNMVVFTFDLSCYHQVLNEDVTKNRMQEQLVFWDSVANSKCFASARIAVLLTKEDKLTPDRLRRYPFRTEFADYTGDPESADNIIKYIVWRLNDLINRQENFRSGRVKFCRSGTISESLKVWETLFSAQGNLF